MRFPFSNICQTAWMPDNLYAAHCFECFGHKSNASTCFCQRRCTHAGICIFNLGCRWADDTAWTFKRRYSWPYLHLSWWRFGGTLRAVWQGNVLVSRVGNIESNGSSDYCAWKALPTHSWLGMLSYTRTVVLCKQDPIDCLESQDYRRRSCWGG